MPMLTNMFDGSWLHPRKARALVASAAVLIAGYASLCPAQSPDPTPSGGTPSNSAQSNSPQSNLASPSRPNPRVTDSTQSTYPSPEDAVGALFQALQSGSEQALQEVLGADNELVSSGDAGQDKLDRERFVQKYQEMHRLAKRSDGTMILSIGAENWPFPVPLVSSKGVWRFDTDDGEKEVFFRRIGENEIAAMHVCHLLVEAQRQLGTDHETSADPEAGSLIKTLLSGAPSGDKAVPFQGYYFRVLSRSRDGFAAVAYPAAYRSSGVMTFVVNQSDVVYEKDFGPAGTRAAHTMSKIQLDSTWKPAKEEASP
jgi:hypothetical protein